MQTTILRLGTAILLPASKQEKSEIHNREHTTQTIPLPTGASP